MIKKFGIILLLIIALIGLGIWSPWNSWNINFLQIIGIDTPEKFSTLKVKSLAGTLDIYVDNKAEGTIADSEDFAQIDTIEKGEHIVTLKRKANKDIYYELTKKINFEPGVEVVIAYDLGPSEAFSEGHILYTTKNFTLQAEPKLNINTNPDGVAIYLDDVLIGTSPVKEIELDINRQHKLRFEKQGYDSLEFTILPENQTDRDKLKDLTLNLDVNLFAQPLKITKEN